MLLFYDTSLENFKSRDESGRVGVNLVFGTCLWLMPSQFLITEGRSLILHCLKPTKGNYQSECIEISSHV